MENTRGCHKKQSGIALRGLCRLPYTFSLEWFIIRPDGIERLDGYEGNFG